MGRWYARLAELRGGSYDHAARVEVVQNVQNVQNPSADPTFEQFEQFEHRAEHAQTPVDTWGDTEDERAAIAEFDGGAPRAWAEAVARLDPNSPPGDVPPRRWLRFIDDCGRFLDGGWAERVTAFGWGPLDLFGCDRERPFVRRDHKGLLWLLDGGTVRELHRDRAIVETTGGALQTYRRRPVEVGRVVLAWQLSARPNPT